MEECERVCCVRGYHIYKHIWEAVVGETVECQREPCNMKDRYAVAVIKDGVIIGHLPRKVSRVCSLFLRRGGSIQCTVVGRRRYLFTEMSSGCSKSVVFGGIKHT